MECTREGQREERLRRSRGPRQKEDAPRGGPRNGPKGGSGKGKRLRVGDAKSSQRRAGEPRRGKTTLTTICQRTRRGDGRKGQTGTGEMWRGSPGKVPERAAEEAACGRKRAAWDDPRLTPAGESEKVVPERARGKDTRQAGGRRRRKTSRGASLATAPKARAEKGYASERGTQRRRRSRT